MTQQRSELGMYGRWQSAYLAYTRCTQKEKQTRPTKQNKELSCASLFNCIRDIGIYPENSSQIRNNGIMMLKMIQLQFTALSLSRMNTENYTSYKGDSQDMLLCSCRLTSASDAESLVQFTQLFSVTRCPSTLGVRKGLAVGDTSGLQLRLCNVSKCTLDLFEKHVSPVDNILQACGSFMVLFF